MAALSNKKLSFKLRSGDSNAMMVSVPSGATISSVKWSFQDTDGIAITPPGFTGNRQYTGVRVEHDDDGCYIRAGDAPTYARLKVKCEISSKDKKGPKTETLTGEVSFSDEWGGMAKSWFPYPANYEVAWDSDPKGRRAIVLIHEAVALLPEEFLRAAGPIPIIRTTNNFSFRGDAFDGAHVPIFFDTVQINDGLIQALRVVPEITTEDRKFIEVVIHETAHAVTYRKCLWDVHHAMAETRKASRTFAPGILAPIGWVRDGMGYTWALITAIAQNLVWPQDIVSDFSAVAGWELAGPLARVVRIVQVPAALWDLGQWLWRLPSQGLAQDYTLRPNIASGTVFGGLFGLKATVIDGQKAAYDKAVEDLAAARKKLDKATGKDRVTAQKEYDTAKKIYDRAQTALQKAATQAGFVSDYATFDPNEDMSETLAFYLLDPFDINDIGTYYGDRSNAALKAKRKFFADEQYLPRRDFPPVKVGSLWRGLDTKDHLDLWKVEL